MSEPIGAAIIKFVTAGAVKNAPAIISNIVGAAALQVGANLLTPKAKFGNVKERDSLNIRGINSRGATDSRSYIYGQVRVGGTVVYMETTGTDNEFLHMVLVHCDHEVEELGDVYVNDVKVNFDSASEGSLRNAQGNRYRNSLYIADHLGGPSQTVDSTLDAASGKWYSSDKLSGMAYTYIRMELKTGEDNAFPNGIPTFTRVVKGRKVYDPRLDSTQTGIGGSGSHRADDSTTWEWSDNWALCVADYITSDFGYGRFGNGWSNINIQELADSADNCDDTVNQRFTNWSASEEVTFGTQRLFTGTGYSSVLRAESDGTTGTTEPSGPFTAGQTGITDGTTSWAVVYLAPTGTEARYTINGVIEADEDPLEVVKEMKGAAAGFIEYIGGSWVITSGRYQAPTITLTESDFAGPIAGTSKDDRTRAINGVRGVIANKDDAYNVIDVPPISDSAYVTEDNGIESFRDLKLLYTTSTSAAQRLFKIELNRARQSLAFRSTFTASAFRLKAGDTFSLDFDRYGWSGKVFQVWSSQLKVGGDGELVVDMEFRETASTLYDYTASSDETVVDPAPNTSLPDPFDISNATGLTTTSSSATMIQTADGTIQPTIHVSWTAAASVNVTGYELRWERFVGQYEYMTLLGREVTSAVIYGVVEDSDYEVQIRSLTPVKTSAWSSVSTVTAIGKSAAPTAPTGFAATAIVEGVKLSMDEHPDIDFKQFLIYQNTTNSKPGTHSYVTTDTTKTITGLTSGQQYYFWLEAEDTTAHTTAAASNVNATPTATAAGDVTGLGALATEDTVDLTTTSPGGVSGVLPTSNTDATDNGTTIDTSGNVNAAIDFTDSGAIKHGKTSSDDASNAGFWLGEDGQATPDFDFHIGDSSNSLKWDGSASTLTVKGDLTAGTVNINDNFKVSSAGAVTIGDDSAGKNYFLFQDTTDNEAAKLGVYDSSGDNVGYLQAVNDWAEFKLFTGSYSTAGHVNIDSQGLVHIKTNGAIDDAFNVERPIGSTSERFNIGITKTGVLEFGLGGTRDCNLYRDSSGVLKTDDSIIVGTNLTLDGRLYDGQATPSSGTSGQVLSSTGTGVEWVDSAASLWTQSGSDIYYNSGRVGIGTPSPMTKLVVSNGGAEGVEFHPSGTAGEVECLFYNRSGATYVDAEMKAMEYRFLSNGTTTALTIDSSQDATFGGNCDANGSMLAGGGLYAGVNDALQGIVHAYGASSGSNGGELRLYTGAAHDSTYDYYFIDAHDDDMRFGRSSGADMVLDSAGRVSIGRSSSTFGDVTYGGAVAKLHVYNAGASGSFRPIARFQAGADANDTGAAIAINHENDRGLLIEGGRGTGNQGIAHFGIIDNTGGVERFMTAKEGGDVYLHGEYLYGPSSKQIFRFHSSFLYINAGSAFSNGIWTGSSDLGLGSADLHVGSNGTPTTARVRIQGGTYNGTNVIDLDGSDGSAYFANKVGIGTPSPANELDVAGTVRIQNTGAATLILDGDTNNSGDAGDTDSIIDMRHDAGAYGMRLSARNFAGKTAFRIQENRGNSYSERFYIDEDGNCGIGTVSPSAKLDVDGVVSSKTGTNSAYSIGVLEITTSATPTQIKITTAIPFSGTTHAHSVTIKGFQYGSANTANLQISWHVYNNSFYNRAATSSGGWAPTIRLAVENGYVVIHLTSPGYWPKLYVESLYNAFGGTSHAQGWSWADAAISADANTPNEVVPYKVNFGNNFAMDSSGRVGIGDSTPSYKLDVNGTGRFTDTLTTEDVLLTAGHNLMRSNHHSGHLEGSYNNVGANSYKSNPIYTIGSNYNPTDAALSDMYGIGYTHTNASFISFTGASGWGMYVAADGDARIFLGGSNGVISSTGEHYVGSNKVFHQGNAPHDFGKSFAGVGYQSGGADLNDYRDLGDHVFYNSGGASTANSPFSSGYAYAWTAGGGDNSSRGVQFTANYGTSAKMYWREMGTSTTWRELLTTDANGNCTASANLDDTLTFGRAKVGYVGFGDYAGFAHYDQASSSGYALLQSSTGDTFINCQSGRDIFFRHANSTRMQLDGSTGNLAIGTSPGGYKLQVEGTGYFADRLTLGDVGSEGGELVILDQNNSGTQKLTVDVDSAGHSRVFQLGNGHLYLGNLTGGTGETRLYANADAKVKVKSTQTEITDQLYVSGYSGSDSIVTINGIDCGGGMLVQGSLDVDVDLDVSGSKNFRIAHPVREGYDLRHTCVESPQADLTYRGQATLVDGTVQVDLDSEFGMTAGTFAALNDEVQVFVQNESGWDAVRGSVSDGVLTIDCQNTNSTDSVGWLVIGRRIGIELEIEPETKIK